MMKIPLSNAATSLLRALIARADVPRNRILLSDWRSVDWQSLTFVGERHEIRLRILGPDALTTAHVLTEGLAEAELPISGQVVADIAVVAAPIQEADGSVSVSIEALTIADELA